MGKEGTCRKEKHVSKPTPAHVAKEWSSGQPVVLKWSIFSSVLLKTAHHVSSSTAFPKQTVWEVDWLSLCLGYKLYLKYQHQGLFHMYHISAQIFGAVGHNNLWIEHLGLGETKLVSRSLGFNTRFQQNRSGIQTPSCRCSHAQHTSFTSRLQVTDLLYRQSYKRGYKFQTQVLPCQFFLTRQNSGQQKPAQELESRSFCTAWQR